MGGLLRSLIFPLLAAVIAGLHYATVLLGCAAKLAQPAYDFFLAGEAFFTKSHASSFQPGSF